MIDQILSVGNKIELEEIARRGGIDDEKRVYVSQLLEFHDDEEDIIMIAMPIFEGKLIPLQIGRRYHMCFYTEKGLYLADGVVENRYRDQNVYIVEMRLSTELKKNQRRQFYRMNWYYKLKYRFLTAEEQESLEKGESFSEFEGDVEFWDGTTLDLSGGGIRFVTRERLEKGSVLMLYMAFQIDKEIKSFKIPAVVISVDITRKDMSLYELRVNFLQISEKDREFIIRYIFNEERKKLQNGG
jgi:c-di-GMP-binding flagellar brake protein YcgR